MANPFGEIAANVGKEVAEGLIKKSAPVVKKAVKKVEDEIEGWGFQPKIGEVSGTKYVEAQNVIDKSQKKYENSNNRVSDLDAEKNVESWDTIEKFYDQLNSAFDREKFSGNLEDDLYPMLFKHLESQGVPRKYTGKIVTHIDDGGYHENEYATANKITNHLKEMNPPERDLFIQVLSEPDAPFNGYNFTAGYVKHYMKDLTREQQETVASLYPEWDGDLADLIQLAKDLKP